MKKYTKDHEWIEQNGAAYRVGITDFAQEQLGDVVVVDLPEVGKELNAGDECMAIESVKAASDIYSPAAGAITAVNDALTDNPALVNESPEKDGWLFDMTLTDPSALNSLMTADQYQQFVEQSQ